MAVLTASQPKFVKVGQTIAAAAVAEAEYKAGGKDLGKGNRKSTRKPREFKPKPKFEPAVVKTGEGHPDLVGRQYKLLTKEDHELNFK
jgi:hypothetical protein